jgi:hypothetical protein
LFLLLKRLKVFVFAFECWRFLFILLDVEGSYFYFLMLKVITFTLGFSKNLLLILDVESFWSYSWILKVITFVLRCWRFLFLFLDVESLCWLLVFFYLHILKKNDVEIYYIIFKSWLYKFSLTYNDERFMKGDFLMIIMLHMSCFVFEHLWWLLLFLCYRVELSLCFINIKIMYTRWDSFKSMKTYATQYFAIIFEWFNESFHIFLIINIFTWVESSILILLKPPPMNYILHPLQFFEIDV